jgi:putative SOS response-associated peptidase YedK
MRAWSGWTTPAPSAAPSRTRSTRSPGRLAEACSLRQIHDRQPVILDPAAYDAWLDPETPAAEAKNLLSRHLDDDLQLHRVSRMVNSVKNQGGGCIEPINSLRSAFG